MPIPRDVPKRLLSGIAPATATQYGQDGDDKAMAFVRDVATARLDLHGNDARNALQTLQRRAQKLLAEKRQ